MTLCRSITLFYFGSYRCGNYVLLKTVLLYTSIAALVTPGRCAATPRY
jgi:hypothetical protein